MNQTNKNGFTLIELSITLVVIGLIISGVLVGRDLINSAEIRAQIKQIEEFNVAINTFKMKYGFLPGDMPPDQAGQLGFFRFTGIYAGKSRYYLGTYFDYGNNDGYIAPETENYAAWSHLSDAKLLKGQYGGTAGNLLYNDTASVSFNAGSPLLGDGTLAYVDKLVPEAKVGGKNISVNISSNKRQNSKYFDEYDTSKLVFWLRNFFESTSFTPVLAYNIDKKIDDGLPRVGIIRSTDGSYTDEVTYDTIMLPCIVGTGANATYNLSPETANNINCDYLIWLR